MSVNEKELFDNITKFHIHPTSPHGPPVDIMTGKNIPVK
jgi:hypothetical protein